MKKTMVHQYKSNGYNIVLDVNSGCVHVVDDLAYDVIALWEKKTPEEIADEMLAKYGSEEGVDKKEIAQVIADVRALQEDVTARQREYLLLYYGERLNMRQIGERLGDRKSVV